MIDLEMLPINEILFSFDFNPYVIFPLMAVIIYAGIAHYIYLQGLSKKENVWFMLMAVMYALAGFSEALARSSVYDTGASFWWSMEAFAQTFMLTITIGAVLVLVGKENLLRGMRKALIFIPAAVTTFLAFYTNLMVDHIPGNGIIEDLGWGRAGGEFAWVLRIWLVLGTLVALAILIIYRFKTDNSKRKKQFTLIAIGIIATMFLYPIIERLQGAIPLISDIPHGPFDTLPIMLSIIYAIKRYGLFEVNPATLVGNLVTTMTEVVFVVNPNDHTIEYVTGDTESVLGYKPEEITGLSLSEIVKDHWESLKQQAFVPIVEGEQNKAVAELEIDTSNRGVVPLKITTSAYREWRSIKGIVVVATDLTETRELLHVMAERNKLVMIQESVLDGLITVDYDNKITMVNTSALKIIGASKEEVMGRPLTEVFERIQKDEETFSVEALLPQRRFDNDDRFFNVTGATIVLYNGSSIDVDLTGSAIKEGKDVNLQTIITLHDLSEEKYLERMKLDFVAMAAHELRTPLTSIKGYLSMYREQYENKSNTEEGLLLGRIDRSAEQLVTLMENLLSASKIEQGELNVYLKSTDWVKLVSEEVDMLQVLATEKGLELKFNKPKAKLPSVAVDQLRIKEVVNNLISNGIKYTQEGSVTVSVEYDEDNNRVLTSIADTGEGIPTEAIPHMFKKFFRVHGELEMGSKGTGLGLFISKSILGLHNGDIWVESEGPGKGSTFKFYLPVSN
ncbi:PAS domain-containing protein [candidate division WWE3 bacterium]|uniref:histidine kinase n=1 Tax=candidate division WWE3 bacterium TaxID=2053526 RepID=A0A955RSD2_UNCKA|nr:PAS domain-containing protein [candidate division WWE3 bacterium]